jgi:hypothetical protein
VIFGLASHRASVASDTFAIVNNKAVSHREGLADFGPGSSFTSTVEWVNPSKRMS